MLPDRFKPHQRHYAKADVPSFAEFAEPFSAGWIARREHGELDGEAFMRVLKAAYDSSGPMLAYKVAMGEMAEGEARHILAERAALAYVTDFAAEARKRLASDEETV